MTSAIRAKREPSDWRRALGISAAEGLSGTSWFEELVRGFIGDRRSLDVGILIVC